ncbi:MAG: uracil-DNA glycosylase [Bdellovibrionales bacterium]|nr:uracil-DNA glycosylase [Bdellovibrionales bacterium]
MSIAQKQLFAEKQDALPAFQTSNDQQPLEAGSALANSWKDVLADERQKPYFKSIIAKIEAERKSGKIIFPANKDIFNALTLCPFDRVKVVIIGQDPYHGPGQAHGLCFSVKPGIPLPPSLTNIYKEIEGDLGLKMPRNYGCLESWARQGVLLLNASLSVRAGQAGSHSAIGWEQFTDKIIFELNRHKKHLVFLLWGSFAKKKCGIINRNLHFVLEAPHPSPLSAQRGFFGCKHFSKTNEILMSRGLSPIQWDQF